MIYTHAGYNLQQAMQAQHIYTENLLLKRFTTEN